MRTEEIMRHVDHTLLSQTAGWEEIRKLCCEALEYHTASVCIPPSYVRQAKEYMGDKMAVCTVIGFPNGYSTMEMKAAETRDAVRNGADEIDMVINLGWVRDGKYDRVEDEIRAVKAAAGERILKVIIETCLLTEDEKIQLCGVVTRAGADYIKTSTGFSTGGATVEDIKLMRAAVGPEMGVKASGGIRDKAAAMAMLEAGATRIGASATGAIVAD